MKPRYSIIGTLLSLLVLYLPAVRAQDGLRGALSRHAETLPGAPGSAQELAIADFDNDDKPDGAILSPAGVLNGQELFRIELHLSTDKNFAITFSTAEPGLAISALDVNGDGAPDIVVEKAFTRQRVLVYLNDGHGAFRKARSDDYPLPDPFAPQWGARLTQYLPAVFLPSTRGFEVAGPQRIAIIRPDGLRSLTFWPEALLAQSGPRAPSAPRAPPFFLSL
jgi:hypothetical protein